MKEDLCLYDIHNHILWGVDDGARDKVMSLKMIDMAYEQGIRGIILTPHYNKRIWDISREEIIKKYNELKKDVDNMYPDMRLYVGNELYYSSSMEDYSDVIRMADSRYILVEFSVETEYKKMCEAVMKLIGNGCIPIIAHAERYECLLKKPELVDELVELGAYIQINAKSIEGDNGRRQKDLSKKLLKRHIVHFVATDAHRDKHRVPQIRGAFLYVKKKYGEEYARKIFVDNPKSIIRNEYIEEIL